MKQFTRILLSSLLCLSVLPLPADAAAKRRAPARAGGGGVVLSTPNPNSPIEHNNRGVELGSKGLWPDAIHEHEIALAQQPGNREFRTNLSSAQLRYGNILFKQGKAYDAIKQFRGALFVDPDNLPADEGLDECYKKLGKHPDDKEYRRRVAEDFETKGQYEDAIVEYRKVLKQDDSGKSHADLGNCLLKADKPVDGYQELRIAVTKLWSNEQKNELSQVHRRLGEILLDYAYKARDRGSGTAALKRLLNAGTCYKRAVTLNPADAQAVGGLIEVARTAVSLKPTFDNYLMLGGAYVLASDFARAKRAYENCFKVDPHRTELGTARVAFHQAVSRSALASDELVAESVGKVNAFLESEPDNPRWLYVLGRLKQKQGDTQGALDAYNRAAKINHLIDPDLVVQMRILGGAPPATQFASAGNPGAGGTTTSAAGLPTQVAAALPATPSVDPRNLEAYGKIESLMSANPDEALTLVSALLEKNPGDGHAWLLKGNIMRKKGQTDPGALDEAAVAFRQAAAFKEGEAESALTMVNTIRVQPNVQKAEEYIQQSNWVKAADELGEAVIKAPNLSFLHRKLADVMRKLNDPKAADREIKKAEELDSKKSN